MLKLAIASAAGTLALITAATAAAGATLLSSSTSTTATTSTSTPSHTAVTDIPADYLALYRKSAATCPGLDWSVLAAVGKIESNHGRSRLPGVRSGTNYAGARGPMQFLSETFASVVAKHPPPPGSRRQPSPYDPRDAIHYAAALLCDSGARDDRNVRAALYAYNHSNQYVRDVLAQAARYRISQRRSPSIRPTAVTAVAYARAQIGRPYRWGGDGPAEGGFDCSGLTKAAYAAAGIALPRTADAQYRAGPQLPRRAPLQPGDLLFYAHPGRPVHHVGIYTGGNQMIHSPVPGSRIKFSDFRTVGPFVGASRPAGISR